ncbi:MAG: DUF1207 domain-containing protein [Elusimicrobia bacterium]|nr:DUF1207 domain-containing protein [Elusimicrobiota bacterium]
MPCALAAVLLTFAANAAAAPVVDVFPRADQVFQELKADPRAIRLGASYYRLEGLDRSDIALGHSWGMTRWRSSSDEWTWQWNIEAMAYSRFTLSGELNSFETVDFFGNLPLAARRGKLSARAMLFHESSHLGDDYIRRTNDQGFRYSIDGLRLTLAHDLTGWARVYGGGTYLLHSVPDPARKAAQAGVELTSGKLGWSKMYPLRLFAAQDLQYREATGYRTNSRTVVGAIIGFDSVPRSMRIYGGRYDGYSAFGQLYRRKESFTDIGISLHF